VSATSVTALFDQWWQARGEWVEAPNQRRAGESGVQRLECAGETLPLYCKRQVGHLYRSLRHPFGEPTVLRERRALLALARLGVGVPEVLYCGARRQQGEWRALLITRALDGFVSLEQWYAQAAAPEDRARVMAAVGKTLARLHRARWQHGCCYPKHLFVRSEADGQVRVALLDLEKSRRRLSTAAASRHDLRQLWRHRQAIPMKDLAILLSDYQQALRG
jgi:tRNA A-37 threonylcarbamoyl transferase component Bud32